MTTVPYGPNAWLVTFADQVDDAAFERGRAIAQFLDARPPEGLREYIAGYTSVLLIFGDPTVKHQEWDIAGAVADLQKAVRGKQSAPAVKEIPTVYDGPDLARVAEHNQLSPDEVVAIHSGTIYKVHMLGFAPGFPYLGDLDGRLHTPRLDDPRTQVPAGSVAIGGEHTGIYSIPNPGGWNLIGRTEVALFDLERGDGEDAFFLRPGDRVKFVPR